MLRADNRNPDSPEGSTIQNESTSPYIAASCIYSGEIEEIKTAFIEEQRPYMWAKSPTLVAKDDLPSAL